MIVFLQGSVLIEVEADGAYSIRRAEILTVERHAQMVEDLKGSLGIEPLHHHAAIRRDAHPLHAVGMDGESHGVCGADETIGAGSVPVTIPEKQLAIRAATPRIAGFADAATPSTTKAAVSEEARLEMVTLPFSSIAMRSVPLVLTTRGTGVVVPIKQLEEGALPEVVQEDWAARVEGRGKSRSPLNRVESVVFIE